MWDDVIIHIDVNNILKDHPVNSYLIELFIRESRYNEGKNMYFMSQKGKITMYKWHRKEIFLHFFKLCDFQMLCNITVGVDSLLLLFCRFFPSVFSFDYTNRKERNS